MDLGRKLLPKGKAYLAKQSQKAGTSHSTALVSQPWKTVTSHYLIFLNDLKPTFKLLLTSFGETSGTDTYQCASPHLWVLRGPWVCVI